MSTSLHRTVDTHITSDSSIPGDSVEVAQRTFAAFAEQSILNCASSEAVQPSCIKCAQPHAPEWTIAEDILPPQFVIEETIAYPAEFAAAAGLPTTVSGDDTDPPNTPLISVVPDINVVIVAVKGTLCIWNYRIGAGTDCAMHSVDLSQLGSTNSTGSEGDAAPPRERICSFVVASPRPGVFDDHIVRLIVVATPVAVCLVGIAPLQRSGSIASRMEAPLSLVPLHKHGYTTSSFTVALSQLATLPSSTCGLPVHVIGTGIDGCLYEVTYGRPSTLAQFLGGSGVSLTALTGSWWRPSSLPLRPLLERVGLKPVADVVVPPAHYAVDMVVDEPRKGLQVVYVLWEGPSHQTIDMYGVSIKASSAASDLSRAAAAAKSSSPVTLTRLSSIPYRDDLWKTLGEVAPVPLPPLVRLVVPPSFGSRDGTRGGLGTFGSSVNTSGELVPVVGGHAYAVDAKRHSRLVALAADGTMFLFQAMLSAFAMGNGTNPGGSLVRLGAIRPPLGLLKSKGLQLNGLLPNSAVAALGLDAVITSVSITAASGTSVDSYSYTRDCLLCYRALPTSLQTAADRPMSTHFTLDFLHCDGPVLAAAPLPAEVTLSTAADPTGHLQLFAALSLPAHFTHPLLPPNRFLLATAFGLSVVRVLTAVDTLKQSLLAAFHRVHTDLHLNIDILDERALAVEKTIEALLRPCEALSPSADLQACVGHALRQLAPASAHGLGMKILSPETLVLLIQMHVEHRVAAATRVFTSPVFDAFQPLYVPPAAPCFGALPLLRDAVASPSHTPAPTPGFASPSLSQARRSVQDPALLTPRPLDGEWTARQNGGLRRVSGRRTRGAWPVDDGDHGSTVHTRRVVRNRADSGELANISTAAGETMESHVAFAIVGALISRICLDDGAQAVFVPAKAVGSVYGPDATQRGLGSAEHMYDNRHDVGGPYILRSSLRLNAATRVVSRILAPWLSSPLLLFSTVDACRVEVPAASGSNKRARRDPEAASLLPDIPAASGGTTTTCTLLMSRAQAESLADQLSALHVFLVRTSTITGPAVGWVSDSAKLSIQRATAPGTVGPEQQMATSILASRPTDASAVERQCLQSVCSFVAHAREAVIFLKALHVLHAAESVDLLCDAATRTGMKSSTLLSLITAASMNVRAPLISPVQASGAAFIQQILHAIVLGGVSRGSPIAAESLLHYFSECPSLITAEHMQYYSALTRLGQAAEMKARADTSDWEGLRRLNAALLRTLEGVVSAIRRVTDGSFLQRVLPHIAPRFVALDAWAELVSVVTHTASALDPRNEAVAWHLNLVRALAPYCQDSLPGAVNGGSSTVSVILENARREPAYQSFLNRQEVYQPVLSALISFLPVSRHALRQDAPDVGKTPDSKEGSAPTVAAPQQAEMIVKAAFSTFDELLLTKVVTLLVQRGALSCVREVGSSTSQKRIRALAPHLQVSVDPAANVVVPEVMYDVLADIHYYCGDYVEAAEYLKLAAYEPGPRSIDQRVVLFERAMSFLPQGSPASSSVSNLLLLAKLQAKVLAVAQEVGAPASDVERLSGKNGVLKADDLAEIIKSNSLPILMLPLMRAAGVTGITVDQTLTILLHVTAAVDAAHLASWSGDALALSSISGISSPSPRAVAIFEIARSGATLPASEFCPVMLLCLLSKGDVNCLKALVFGISVGGAENAAEAVLSEWETLTGGEFALPQTLRAWDAYDGPRQRFVQAIKHPGATASRYLGVVAILTAASKRPGSISTTVALKFLREATQHFCSSSRTNEAVAAIHELQRLKQCFK